MPNCAEQAKAAVRGASAASRRLSAIATRKATRKAANGCPAGGCKKPTAKKPSIPRHKHKNC